MLIVSGWSYWEMCLAHLHWTGPLSCCFVSKILQYSECPLIISPTNVSKQSESFIKFALDAANPSAFSPTFMKNIFHLISLYLSTGNNLRAKSILQEWERNSSPLQDEKWKKLKQTLEMKISRSVT
jgi:hypothetical protein